jgi:hypothetical protein
MIRLNEGPHLDATALIEVVRAYLK